MRIFSGRVEGNYFFLYYCLFIIDFIIRCVHDLSDVWVRDMNIGCFGVDFPGFWKYLVQIKTRISLLLLIPFKVINKALIK